VSFPIFRSSFQFSGRPHACLIMANVLFPRCYDLSLSVTDSVIATLVIVCMIHTVVPACVTVKSLGKVKKNCRQLDN
jgi:hypothetical protein